MQTPEEFAADMHASMLSCDREDLIRARDAEVRADERAKVLAEVAGRAHFDHTPECVSEAHWLDWHPDCGACWQDRIDAVGGEEP